MRIGIQKYGNGPKTNKPEIPVFQKGVVTFVGVFLTKLPTRTYFKYIIHVKISLLGTLKFDQETEKIRLRMNPHWFGSLDSARSSLT